jgi:hypothetical protein
LPAGGEHAPRGWRPGGGEDWWPYGVEANRTAIDTFLRHHYEQGLSTRLLTE